jgi:chromosome segregation ATPase
VQSSQEPEEDDASVGAPDAAVYKGHSGGIIETLQGLLDKAEGQLSDARHTETASLHNFELLKQSLEDGIKFANKDMDEAKSASAASGEAKAAAEGDLAVTAKDLAEDVKSLADLHHECMTGATEFEEGTKSRGEELAALAEAKRVISEATGGAEKLTYGLDQVSFLQVSRSKMFSGVDLANSNAAVKFMRNLARKHSDPALAQLASRMASAIRFGASDGADPFAKVKGLISDMIARLQADAAADASHKAFCDKEMSETNAKKAEKDAEIAKLTTKIDQMSARSAQLKEEVATLQKELAELAKVQAEMDKLRQEEKAAYDANRPEMEQGLEGVKMALQILRDYYAKEDKAHEAAEGAAGGIVGLLEVVESDLSKGLAEMIATEEAAAAEYDKQTKENAVTKTTKEQDVKYKTQEFTRLDKAVSDATSEREGVQTELDAVLEYLEKLKEQCVAKAETYEERVRRREAELAGLREALQILEGEAVLLQKTATHALRGSA